MSRYHVCVKKQALHFGTNRMDEAFELALYLKRQGRDVEIVDNVTGLGIELPQPTTGGNGENRKSRRSTRIVTV